MKLEKKLIVCSILAIAIGVASIVPLVFFMSANAQTNPDDQPQFNLNIPYAYVGDYWDNNSQTFSPTSVHVFYMENFSSDINMIYTIAFNSTPKFDPKTIDADAIFEYYLIDVSSEKGLIGNLTYFTSVNCNSSKQYDNFHFSRDQWFDSNSTDAFSIASWGNNPTLGFKCGTGTNWNHNLGEPETLFITVRRQGWVILNDNSTVAHLANPDVILQIQLEKYGDGFLYNNIIPEDELAQINPLTPQHKMLK